MTDRPTLIAHLKAAPGPSEELDADISEAVGLWPPGTHREGTMFWCERKEYEGRIGYGAPPYTSVIDAALGTARTRLEQWIMLRDMRHPAARGDGDDPPTPPFELCRAALLVRLGGEE